MAPAVAAEPFLRRSAPDRLLLGAVSGSPPADGSLLHELCAGDFPWRTAMTAAAENRVAGFVATLVESEPFASRVAAEVRADWRALRMLQVFRSEAAERQLRETAAALARVGVAPLLYKGLDFQERLYAADGTRGFADLDLLVRRADVETAVVALEQMGYTLQRGGLPLWFHRRFHLHGVFIHRWHRRPLELHWALDSPYADLIDPAPAILDAADTSEGFGPNVLRPTPTDALVLMATHLEKHIGLCATLPQSSARLAAVIEARGLIWVLDVVRWMRTQPEALRAAEVGRRIRELYAERAIVVALRLAHDLDPSALPGWARALAERLPHRGSLLQRLVYPDLTQAPQGTGCGRRRRRWLLTMLPRLGFRPVRVLEAMLPRHAVPHTPRSWRSWWPLRTTRSLGRMGAELVALGAVRLCQRRKRALALRAATDQR